MADILISGKLTTNSSGKIIVGGENVAYSSEQVGSGLMQYEKLTKSVNQKINEVDSIANSAKIKADNVENELNILKDTVEKIGTGDGDNNPNLELQVASLNTKVTTLESTVTGRNTGLVDKVSNLTTSVTKNTNDISAIKTILENPSHGVETETDPIYTADKENIVFKNDLTNEIETAVDQKFAEGVGRELMDAKTALDNAVEDVKQTEKTLEQQVLQINHSLVNDLDSVLNSIQNASLDIDYNDEGSFQNVVYSLLNLQQQIDVLKDRIQLVSEEDYNSISHTLPDGILYLIPEE